MIKFYTNEKKELENGQKTAKHLFKANFRMVKLTSLNTALSTIITFGGQFLYLVVGAILLQQVKINIGQ